MAVLDLKRLRDNIEITLIASDCVPSEEISAIAKNIIDDVIDEIVHSEMTIKNDEFLNITYE